VRAYAFDLLAFCRWLIHEGVGLGEVTTDVLLRFLAACRTTVLPGQAPNAFVLADGRGVGYAPTTVNRRLAAISGLFSFRAMRDPDAGNPVPRGKPARTTSKAERAGLLGHLAAPKARSGLRLREPRQLPRGLDRDEVTTLLGSFRTWRDRAIAGLLLPTPSGLCFGLPLAFPCQASR
jgi:integrase